MAYDIPDKIQYKEKIVFNLTFKQLLYAITFGLLAFFSFGLHLEGDAKYFLPSSFSLLGFGFIFLNLDKTLSDRVAYISGIREGGAIDKRVQKFIGVKKIENDTVYLENNSMRAVLSVTPINFQNMDASRKKSVILNYRDFLNQLTHPIQILVRTVNVDLSEYFAHHDERVEKTHNPQLIALYKEFKLFEQNYINENRVKERLYYLIVPYESAHSLKNRHKDRLQIFKEKTHALFSGKLEKLAAYQDESNRKELSDRVEIICSKLLECGLVSRRLNSNELISLYMSYFDGYAEVDEDYLSRVVVARTFLERRENDGKKESSAKIGS